MPPINHESDDSKQLVSLLVEDGIIPSKDYQTALAIQRTQGGRLIEIVLGLCPFSEEELYQALAKRLGRPFWSETQLLSFKISPTLFQKFTLPLMMEHSFLPIKLDRYNGSLHVALPNPLDRRTLDAIKLFAQVDNLTIGISSPTALLNVIQIRYRESISHPIDSQNQLPALDVPPLPPEAETPIPEIQATPSSYGISPPKIAVKACPTCDHPVPEYEEHCPQCGSPLNLSQADPLIGKVVKRFRLVQKLGEGGMGLVYKAEDITTGQDAALKILRANLSTNERVVRRFYQEAKAQNQLQHPGIVHVNDFGFEEGIGFFIAMEFLRGISLENFLEERLDQLTLDLIRAIMEQVCDAMGFAHSRGIYHRDLKPDNIFLLENPWNNPLQQRVKIFDFGVAKMVASDEDQRLTRTGMTIGTPRYMAPEQAGEGTSDHRADIYSLGVILFEILTGKPPFEGNSAYQIMLRHVYADPPALSQVRPDLPYPKELEDLIFRVLAKNPQERPNSMDQLWQDLSHALDIFAQYIPSNVPLLHKVSSLSRHLANKAKENEESADQPVIVGRILPSDKKTSSPNEELHSSFYSSEGAVEPISLASATSQEIADSPIAIKPRGSKKKRSSKSSKRISKLPPNRPRHTPTESSAIDKKTTKPTTKPNKPLIKTSTNTTGANPRFPRTNTPPFSRPKPIKAHAFKQPPPESEGKNFTQTILLILISLILGVAIAFFLLK